MSRSTPNSCNADRVPVLTYHAVVERAEDLDRWPAGARRYVFTAEEFIRHLDYLVASKFETLAMADLVRWLDGERELPERPVVLSFDDGHASNATCVTPALAERGQRGIFFITAGRIGRDESFVNWHQLLAMDEAGMEIGSHTLTHPFPSALKPQTLAHELSESKRILEDGVGTSVDYASSPSGYDSRHFARLAREAGYRAALQGRLRPNGRSTDRFALGRFVLKRAHDFEFFVRLIEPRSRAWRPLRRRQMVRNAARAVLGPRGYEAVRSWLLGERSGDRSWP